MKLVDDTITIFNKYIDSETKFKKYISTVVTGVHWYGTDMVSVTSDGLVGANKFTIRIPEEADFGEKEYVSPKDFSKLTDKSGYFTIAEGDIIVHGVAEEDEAKPDYLEDTYDEVVTIISVTDNRKAPNAKHWRVVCK